MADLFVAPAQWGDQNQRDTEVRGLFQGPVGPCRTYHDDSDDQLFDLTNDELQIAAPAQPSPPTPSSSTIDGVRCVGGHLICPRHPLDVSEVTMQKEILTPPKVPPSTLGQACKWLEDTQHRLNL